MWEDVLGDEFLVRQRLSRIYFGGKFYAYPLRAEDVVRRLGVVETVRCIGSYLAAKLRRHEPADSFEDWVTARFGRRLYDVFFRSYTEKVWGIPGDEIQSEWAAQRIKNLSFWTALTSALRLNRTHVTSLIEEFHYPRLGPGSDVGDARRADRGRPAPGSAGIAARNAAPRRLHDHERRRSSRTEGVEEHQVDGVISTIALSGLILSLDPPPPPHVVERGRAAPLSRPRRRRVMTDGARAVPGQLDLPARSRASRAGRVQNFGAWSPEMTFRAPTCLAPSTLLRGRDLGDARAGGDDGHPGWRASGWSTRKRSWRGEGPRPEGVSDVRPRSTTSPSTSCGDTSSDSRTCRRAAATVCTATTTRTIRW